MRISFLFILLGMSAQASTPLCNGSAENCIKRYDQVVYPTTHNSTAVSPGYGPHPVWFIPNQEKGVNTQLKDGIRGFMIDAHYYDGAAIRQHRGEVWACHESCALGGQKLVSVLSGMKKFLDENPNEVVTIIFESYVSSTSMTEQFIESGLLRYAYAQPQGAAWPTLGEMIQKNQRLVVLTDKKDQGPDWYMDVWAYAVETPYSYKSVKEFTCNFNRGVASNSLYILNHFLTKALFRRAFARKPNQFSRILNRVRKCHKEKSKVPNFLTVDFYRTSKVVQAAQLLNTEF